MSNTQPPDACQVVRECLGAYLDGELDATRSHVVSEHLNQCHDCAAERTSLTAAWSQVDRMSRIEARADLWQRLEPQLPKEIDPGNRVAVILATAASIGGLMLGIQLGRAATPERVTEPVVVSDQRSVPSSVSEAEYFSALPVNTFSASVLELTAALARQTEETNP